MANTKITLPDLTTGLQQVTIMVSIPNPAAGTYPVFLSVPWDFSVSGVSHVIVGGTSQEWELEIDSTPVSFDGDSSPLATTTSATLQTNLTANTASADEAFDLVLQAPTGSPTSFVMQILLTRTG